MSDFLSREREREICETHPGDWLAGPWTQRYVEANGDTPAYNEVLHHESGTVIATLPDWAGGIALFLADAHDAVPELLTEIKRLRADRAEIIAERDAQIVTWLTKKSREYGDNNRENRAKAEAVGRMADKLSRGAVRENNLLMPPRTERSYWVGIANVLNEATAAGMPVGIDLDGTLTDRNAWSVVWDRDAERWTVAGYEHDEVTS